MACFIVPAAEAIVASVACVSLSKRTERIAAQPQQSASVARRSTFVRKLRWLTGMLWGGSALLALEHFWHGEIVPWFPFLTAASDPAARTEMLHEMATAGVAMAVLVTAVWGLMVLLSGIAERRANLAPAVREAEE